MKVIKLYPTLVPTDHIKIWEIHARDKKELIFSGRVDEMKLEQFIKIKDRQVFEIGVSYDTVEEPRTMTNSIINPRLEIYIMEEI